MPRGSDCNASDFDDYFHMAIGEKVKVTNHEKRSKPNVEIFFGLDV